MRLFNRLVSVLLALALLAGGIVVAVEGILVAADRPAWIVPRRSWYDTATTTHWADTPVLAVSVAAVVLGLAVLVVQLRRWAPDRLPVADGWHVQRRATERHLVEAVSRIPAVTVTRARLRRGWKVAVTASGRRDDRPAVRKVVQEELAHLSAPGTDHVSIRMTRPRRVA
ncbi:hypothetical protein AB0M43_00510 [Longispora sp. NPDC051575]|uniref:hypothetical protein n=1 Tax=Longispora sp. NPDC051575 TaxID=3154943 RepID=UPI003412D74A